MEKIDLNNKFSMFSEYWTPKIVGELNGQYVKLAKFKGEMIWHSHDAEDEFFQVIKGSITLHLRDRSIELNEGQCFIIPKGVEHKPEAAEEAHVLLFEPMATAHTGRIGSDLTVPVEDQQHI